MPLAPAMTTELATPLDGLGIPVAIVTPTVDVVHRNCFWLHDSAFCDAVATRGALRRTIEAVNRTGSVQRVGVEFDGRGVDVSVGPAGRPGLFVVAILGAGGPDALGAHDPLTDMLTPDGFAAVLALELRARDAAIPVVLIDLDGFFYANAVWGRTFGDRLVGAVVSRIRQVFGRADIYARVGPDHFVVACPGRTVDGAIATAREFVGLLAEPFELGGRTVRVGCHIGVAVGHSGDDPIGVVRRAHVAFVHSLITSSPVRLYDPAMHAGVVDEMCLYQDLRQALLDCRHFRVLYQPQFDLRTGRVTAVDARVAWQHPVRGLLTAGAFLRDASRFGLLEELDAWVMHQACTQLRHWRDVILPAHDLVVSVKVTANAIASVGGVDRIGEILHRNRLPATSLEIELAAECLTTDIDELAASVGALRRTGVRIAVGDIGSSCASLLNLSRLEVDTLAIDPAFIRGLGHDATSTAMVTATMTIARDRNATTIADGIETAGQLEVVTALGVHRGQGAWLSPALNATDTARLLAGTTALRPGPALPQASLTQPRVG